MLAFEEKLKSLLNKKVNLRFNGWNNTYCAELKYIDFDNDTLVIKGRWAEEEYFKISYLYSFYEDNGEE